MCVSRWVTYWAVYECLIDTWHENIFGISHNNATGNLFPIVDGFPRILYCVPSYHDLFSVKFNLLIIQKKKKNIFSIVDDEKWNKLSYSDKISHCLSSYMIIMKISISTFATINHLSIINSCVTFVQQTIIV